MANKRNLKKHVSYACGDIAAECIVASHLIKGADSAALESLVMKIALLQDATIRKVNIAFDKTPGSFEDVKIYNAARRKYFRTAYGKLIETFNAEIRGIVDEMNKAIPHGQKA